MNVFTFSGNLGRDAEVKQVAGTSVANFSVACKAGIGDKATTTWINCAIWGKRAEGGLIQYLKKGQQVIVSGELSSREYQANDGSTKTSIDLRVNDLTLAGGKSDQAAPSAAPAQQQAYSQPAQQQVPLQNHQQPPTSGEVWVDDIPF